MLDQGEYVFGSRTSGCRIFVGKPKFVGQSKPWMDGREYGALSLSDLLGQLAWALEFCFERVKGLLFRSLVTPHRQPVPCLGQSHPPEGYI